MLLLSAIIAAALLAFANGANDNFKGVATLYGSGTTSYRRALLWATATTFIGSAVAWCLTGTLLARFSGKGFVPDITVADPRFLATVAWGAGLTVIMATRLGFPISTTHALVGSMSGAALASDASVQWGMLAATFLLPLAISPLAALVATVMLYPVLSRLRCYLGVEKQSCVCIGSEIVPTTAATPATPSLAMAIAAPATIVLSTTVGTQPGCSERYAGRFFGLGAGRTLDFLHFISAGLVSLARGLNDTPKIAAILLVAPSVDGPVALVVCGVFIGVGGLIAARRVAHSMSHRITGMNAGQGFTANLMTSLLVIGASRWGLPVSTTHVTCGALFGIGVVNRQAHWRFIFQLLATWLTTLPVSAILGWVVYQVLVW